MEEENGKLEGKVATFEIDLIFQERRYGSYRSLIEETTTLNRERAFANVRYGVALAHIFNQINALEQYMFIGGLGVLGNMVRYLGDEKILECRDTHDLDLIVRSKNYLQVIEKFFDTTEVITSSLSIKNKLIIKGHSFDAEERKIDDADIDLYTPNGDPRKGITINNRIVNEKHWNRRKEADFFGVPVSVANPLDLLNMKLDITSGNGSARRKKDYEDILNLTGIIEKDGYIPTHIRRELSHQFNKFKTIIDPQSIYCSQEDVQHAICPLNPTEMYVNEILKLED